MLQRIGGGHVGDRRCLKAVSRMFVFVRISGNMWKRVYKTSRGDCKRMFFISRLREEALKILKKIFAVGEYYFIHTNTSYEVEYLNQRSILIISTNIY